MESAHKIEAESARLNLHELLFPLEISCFCGIGQPLNLNTLVQLSILYSADSVQIQGVSL